MDIQTLSIRLSECLDDLSLLLDQLYKFPQRQREAFFQKIHSLKNRLLSVKSSLRETPLPTSQKHYKQLYLAMNSLKNQLTLQTAALQTTKENREGNVRVREIKEVRRNYEDAMRVAVEREEEVRSLRGELYEKEEVVRLNFVELQRLRGEVELLLEDNRRLQFQRTTVQLELESVRAAIDRTSDTALQFRVREQQKDRCFLSAVEQLQHLKGELISANEKLAHFQQLAEVSIRKTRQVQENIKKVEREAQGLNENYRLREGENFRKLRELGEVEFQLGLMAEQNRQLELQNRRLREDVEVLESEIIKLNKAAAEQRTILGQDRERITAEQRRLITQIETASIREGQLRRVIQEWQKKYLLAVGKLNTSEQLKIRNRQLQVRLETIQDRIKRTELALEQSKKEGLQFLREKQRMGEQLQTQTRMTREAELQAFRLREKGKIKEEERTRLILELEGMQARLKEGERALAVVEVSRESLETQLMDERGRVTKGEERGRIKEKQIETLRVKLLQAKIQTVHEIREVINA